MNTSISSTLVHLHVFQSWERSVEVMLSLFPQLLFEALSLSVNTILASSPGCPQKRRGESEVGVPGRRVGAGHGDEATKIYILCENNFNNTVLHPNVYTSGPNLRLQL